MPDLCGVLLKSRGKLEVPKRDVVREFPLPQGAFVLKEVADLFAVTEHPVGLTSTGYDTDSVGFFVVANVIFCSSVVGSRGYFRVRCDGDVILGWDTCPFEAV